MNRRRAVLVLAIVCIMASVVSAFTYYLVSGSYYPLMGIILIWLAVRLLLPRLSPKLRGWARKEPEESRSPQSA